MKEVIITKYGPPEVLQVRKLKTPIPKDNQVLVQNYFTGVNFSEIMARMRLYPGAPKPPATLGSENWKRSYKCLSPMGKLIVYGDQNFVKGKSFSLYASLKEVFSMPKYKPIDLMSENKSIMGYHLGRLADAENKIQRAVLELNQIVQNNNIKPVIDKIFPYTEAHKAHSYI